jgi:hypothetical protein
LTVRQRRDSSDLLEGEVAAPDEPSDHGHYRGLLGRSANIAVSHCQCSGDDPRQGNAQPGQDQDIALFAGGHRVSPAPYPAGGRAADPDEHPCVPPPIEALPRDAQALDLAWSWPVRRCGDMGALGSAALPPPLTNR